jgi:hypothetical protein
LWLLSSFRAKLINAFVEQAKLACDFRKDAQKKIA